MCRPTIVRFRASLLLAVMAVWFVNVALCCQPVAAPVRAAAPSCHGHPANSTGAPDHPAHADGACCVGLTVFPAQAAAAELAALPAVGQPLLFPGWADDHLPAPAVFAMRASDTGPPGRSWFAELVLQRSLPGRAPPLFA